MSDAFYEDDVEQTESDRIMQLVCFNIGQEIFGVDILRVQEIIRATPITPIPDSPDFIEGVINLRGSIIPVIDLRKRLELVGKKDSEEKIWIIILNINNRTTGFIVDSVSEVLKISKTEIKPPPDIVSDGLEAQYIIGVCKVDEGLLVLLDFSRILRVDEMKKLTNL